ncbi:Gfo/Idh/MocA family protein [Parabacteroides chinchillae]
MKRRILSIIIIACLAIGVTYAQKVIKVGIIGLDTSHSPAFIGMLNSKNPKPEFSGFKVVAAYPYGSRTIENSMKRIPGYIDKAKENGVEIVNSIADLLKKVDCVMLETNDGNLHLEQALEVLKAGKILYIDKPVAADLTETIAIFMLADKYKVPVFSSSALRYVPQNQDLRNGKFGKIMGADCCSPAPGEPSHTDFAWYGIHGVETLYTVMGTGCKQVSRTSAKGTDVVVGLWEDGRIGTFRGIRQGKDAYGGTAYCEGGKVQVGEYSGYECLLVQIVNFFKTKVVPVTPEETIEIFTFMEASNESMRQGGCPVSMQAVYDKARYEAAKIVAKY